MRKGVIMFLVVLITAIIPLLPSVRADGCSQVDCATFVYPAMLQTIEEDAFNGTAVEIIVFPDGLIYIGEGAFRNTQRLTEVYIPRTTAFIAESAFSGSVTYTIYGIDGSYAQKWAKKHKVPFVIRDIWSGVPDSGRIHYSENVPIRHPVMVANPEKIIVVHGRGEDEGRSKRPQERPELNPIDYRFP